MNFDRIDQAPIHLDSLDLVYQQSSNVDHMVLLLAQNQRAAQLDRSELRLAIHVQPLKECMITTRELYKYHPNRLLQIGKKNTNRLVYICIHFIRILNDL